MTYLIVFTTIIFIIYCYKINKFKRKISSPQIFKPIENNTVPISVIIAVKNGANSLLSLIKCLKNQTYSGVLEFIIVDDESNDDTYKIIKNIENEDSRFKYTSSFNGNNILSFKKKALDAGIKFASHEWLLFTDVDCRPHKNWVKEMAEFFTNNADYVVGLSSTIPSETKVSLFQSVDFQMLMGATIAQCNIRKPWACTGQNQAYRKSLFNKVGGFKYISNLLQGDDSVFMQICRHNNANIVIALTKNVMIARTENSWWSFLKQRMRWAGDSKYMLKLCPNFFLMSLITFLTNLLIFTLLILGHINFFIMCLIIKVGFEAKFYQSLTSTPILKNNNYENFILWSLLQIPYIILMGTISLWSHQLFGWDKSKN